MGLALAALAAGGPWLCTVQAGSKERGRSIEFSDPKSDETTTNLHQLTSKNDSLKQLEEDAYKSVKTLWGGSSLDGVAPPPMQPSVAPVVPSKRLKELLERRRNFFLLSPEDLAHAPTLHEMLNVPEYGQDGLEKQPKSPLERFYEREDAKRIGALKPIRFQGDDTSGTPDTSSGRETPAPPDDMALPGALHEKEQALKKLFESERADNSLSPPTSKRSTFSDIFGVGEGAPSREKEVLKLKKMRDEVNSIWEPSRPAASADSRNTLVGSTESSRRLANPFGVPNTPPGSFSPINPIFTPPGPQDVNVQVTQPNPAPLVPKVEVSRPVAPTFAAPQRPPL
jgi:hypothetical protein